MVEAADAAYAPSNLRFLVSCSSAFSNFVTFSAMAATNACSTSWLCCTKSCAANFPMLAGLQMNAFEEPGGFVRQVWFMPSGGQEITGWIERYEAVPERASVPPAQPTINMRSTVLL